MQILISTSAKSKLTIEALNSAFKPFALKPIKSSLAEADIPKAVADAVKLYTNAGKLTVDTHMIFYGKSTSPSQYAQGLLDDLKRAQADKATVFKGPRFAAYEKALKGLVDSSAGIKEYCTLITTLCVQFKLVKMKYKDSKGVKKAEYKTALDEIAKLTGFKV